MAAFASNDAALKALATAGADMNALDNQVYDVLTIATVANDPELVSLALHLGNRPDLITSVYDGTALIAGAHLGHHEVVQGSGRLRTLSTTTRRRRTRSPGSSPA